MKLVYSIKHLNMGDKIVVVSEFHLMLDEVLINIIYVIFL